MPIVPRVSSPGVEETINPSARFTAQASPDAFSAIGRSIDQVGQVIGQVAAYNNHLKNQQAEQDATAYAIQNAGDFRGSWTQRALKRREGASDGAENYSDSLMTDMGKDASTRLDAAPNRRARELLQNHLAGITASIGDEAVRWQDVQRQKYQGDKIKQGLNSTENAVFDDPSQYQSALDHFNQSIDSDGTLHPDVRANFKLEAQQRLAFAAKYGDVEHQPAAAAAQLRGTVPIQPTSIAGKIRAEAQAHGVDPTTALAISSIETGGKFNPDAQNPKSSAHGLFQLLDGTWQQYAPGQDRGNPDAQVKAGVAFIADVQRSLRTSLGREPTPTETYMGHLFGAAGAAAILKSPDGMPIREAVARYDPANADTVASKNGMAGMTVGDAKSLWTKVVSQHMLEAKGLAAAPIKANADALPDMQLGGPDGGRVGPVQPKSGDPALDSLSLAHRMQLLSHADALLRQHQSEGVAALNRRIADTTEAYAAGKDAANPPTLADYLAVHKPGDALAMFQQQVAWQQYGVARGQVNTLPYEQQKQFVEDHRPTNPGAPGYSGDLQRFQMLEKALDDVNTARRGDAIGTALQVGNYPALKPLTLSNPTLLPQQLADRAMIADQVSKDYGVPPTILSASEASELSSGLQEMKSSAQVDYLSSVRRGLKDDTHFLSVMQKIAPDHPVLAAAGAIAAKQEKLTQQPHRWSSPQIESSGNVAATIIEGEHLLNPNKTDKKEDGKPDVSWMPKAKDMEGYFNAYVGDAMNAKDRDIAWQTARAYYAGAASGAHKTDGGLDRDLWQKSMWVATGGITGFGTGKQVQLPWGMSADAFPNEAQAAFALETEKQTGGRDTYGPLSAYGLLSVGDGRYAVTQGNYALNGADGNPMVIDLYGDHQPSQPMALDAQNIRGPGGRQTDPRFDRVALARKFK